MFFFFSHHRIISFVCRYIPAPANQAMGRPSSITVRTCSAICNVSRDTVVLPPRLPTCGPVTRFAMAMLAADSTSDRPGRQPSGNPGSTTLSSLVKDVRGDHPTTTVGSSTTPAATAGPEVFFDSGSFSRNSVGSCPTVSSSINCSVFFKFHGYPIDVCDYLHCFFCARHP